jgi:hypothetical protein
VTQKRKEYISLKVSINSSMSNRYHPGMCEATDRGKRYGKNLEPQRYDESNHAWHLAKDENWGEWSCCGRAANSPPCEARPRALPEEQLLLNADNEETSVGVGAYIQFLIGSHNLVRVAAEKPKAWALEGGRIAKKETEGRSWVWYQQYKASDGYHQKNTKKV